VSFIPNSDVPSWYLTAVPPGWGVVTIPAKWNAFVNRLPPFLIILQCKNSVKEHVHRLFTRCLSLKAKLNMKKGFYSVFDKLKKRMPFRRQACCRHALEMFTVLFVRQPFIFSQNRWLSVDKLYFALLLLVCRFLWLKTKTNFRFVEGVM